MARVLTVDDDEEARDFVDVLLTAHGYQVATAANGAEALAAARKNPPDVLLTDALMPEMDGFTLCRYWMEDERLRSIPFVFYTANYTDPSSERFALSLGARLFVRKPVAPEELVRIVNDLVRAPAAPVVSRGTATPPEAFYRAHTEIIGRKLDEKVKLQEKTQSELRQRLGQLAQSQAQLQKAQKMEALGRLAGGVAHDFNNLLTAVLFATELAEWKLAKGESVQQELEQVRQACAQAARLSNQLLAVSRRQQLIPTVNDLGHVVGGVGGLLERALGANTQLEVDLPETPTPVLVDRGQIEQVVMNLAINARDAMENGGVVRISVDVANLGTLEASAAGLAPGEYARLSVSDTGIGMSEETRRHIFEPFFTTKGERGTGLGLSTVHGIVTQSGGGLDLHSAVGHGSVFDVYLPLCRERTHDVQAPRSERPQVSIVAPTRETVLVVDEDRQSALDTRDWLTAAGFRVLSAESAEQALQLGYGKQQVDLLLANVVLSGLSGTALAGRLRRTHPNLRVLMSSSYLPTGPLSRDESAVHCIARPYARGELLKEIEAVLRGGTAAKAPSDEAI